MAICRHDAVSRSRQGAWENSLVCAIIPNDLDILAGQDYAHRIAKRLGDDLDLLTGQPELRAGEHGEEFGFQGG